MALPLDTDLKRVAVTQEPNSWHVSIQFEAVPKVYAEPTLPLVGIDGGLAHLATLSDGTRIAHPRLARKAAKRIWRLNRERDRRRRASVNRKCTVARLGRTHHALGSARKDAMHKATRTLVDIYAGFGVENLSLRGLMRTRMASSLADAGLDGMLRILRYKAEWAGRGWHVHPRFQRSTGVCPKCNHVGPRLSLSVRSWACDCCGAAHDRDVAAAQVILCGAIGQVMPEPAAATPRKRGFAVRDGVLAQAGTSHGGPPVNVAKARAA